MAVNIFQMILELRVRLMRSFKMRRAMDGAVMMMTLTYRYVRLCCYTVLIGLLDTCVLI